MNRSIRVALAALASFTAVTPLLSSASENQLIDDFWMRDKSTTAPARSAPPPTSTRSAPAISREPAAVSGGGASATAQGGAGLVPAVQGLPPDPGDSGTYRLAPGDVIKVQVFQVDELSSEERVSEDGEIVMPLIGPVPVGGMTPRRPRPTSPASSGRITCRIPRWTSMSPSLPTNRSRSWAR